MHATGRLDFLFATWEGGGNVPPALTAVRTLVAAGHRVRVLCDRCSRPGVEEAGAEFIPWHRVPSCSDRAKAAELLRDWEAPNPAEGFGRLRDEIMFGPALAYAQDLIDEIRCQRPHLVVGSDMLFGVMAACEADRQPLALLATNLSLFPIEGIPPFGAGLTPVRTAAERSLHEQIASESRAMFNAGLPALNAARCALGLPPVREVLDQLAAARRLLLATSRSFDFPAERIPGWIRYVGPLLGEPQWAESWRSPWLNNDPRPLVLVAFSSTFQDQSPVLRRVVTALASLPVRAAVTLGPALAGECIEPPAPNIVVCTSAPHDAIMREAVLVVTHGGHGTVMRALAHGRPLLCMPMGRDQNDNTARVLAHRAGLSLPPEAPPEQIADCVKRLLDKPYLANNAQRLGDLIAAEVASSRAAVELTLSAQLGHCEESHLSKSPSTCPCEDVTPHNDNQRGTSHVADA